MARTTNLSRPIVGARHTEALRLADDVGAVFAAGTRDPRAGQAARISEALRRLAAFGAKELARVGRVSGRCCYCSRTLTDPQSMDLGYGPVCAKYHGLPHPNRHGF